MSGLLKSEGASSSMRFSLILTSIGVFVLILSTATYIVLSAITPEMGEPSWETIGVFCVGVAGVITGIGYNKVQQKKVELNGKKPN